VIHIWLRATVDWEDEDAFWAKVPPEFKPTVERWNATFDMPFHMFRRRVREIAALNHSRVENAVWASWDEIPDGARVVPVDDDDWFAPHLGRVLESEWDSEPGIHWTGSWVGVPVEFGHRIHLIRRALFPFTRPIWTCQTNNYGVVKRPGVQPLLASHQRACEWFDGPGRQAVKRIRPRLSVHNRTMGSITSLRPHRRRGELDRTRLVRRLGYFRLLYRRPPWGRGLVWCRPYLAMMADLMDEVKPR
jgi:hypothetical protein